MVVLFGGISNYFGINLIVFAVFRVGYELVVFDMVMIVQVWGKILDVCLRDVEIFDIWVVDEKGQLMIDFYEV